MHDSESTIVTHKSRARKSHRHMFDLRNPRNHTSIVHVSLCSYASHVKANFSFAACSMYFLISYKYT